ncbi:MAG: alpha/beta hydrolase [Phycisphaeraceae bacterium]|nr:alpha/beta hydrolase [Phycisphaeraceae bacterium]
MSHTIALWPADQNRLSDPAVPRLTVHPHPSAGRRATVLIFPGGGYQNLAPHENEPVVKWLQAAGFHTAVVSYRINAASLHPAPILDAQRAIRLLRHHGPEWGLGIGPIGVIGFSAGGHLASMLAIRFDRYGCEQDDLAARYSSRPNAAVLCYAVLDFVNYPGKNHPRPTLGKEPSQELVEELSTVRWAWKQMPPIFLWHTVNDDVVPVENSLAMAMACQKEGRPVELHLYEEGLCHGLGVSDEKDPRVISWKPLAVDFLRRHLPVGD